MYLIIQKYFSSDMCGPIEKCCCCFPANVGVKFIGMCLLLADVSGLIYSTIILQINNKVRDFVISAKTTFLLLLVLPRDTGARDAELHLVCGGGDTRLLCPHHHQHSSHRRISQEKQAKFCHRNLGVLYILPQKSLSFPISHKSLKSVKTAQKVPKILIFLKISPP